MRQQAPGSGASIREDAGPAPVQLHRVPEAMRLLSLSRSVIYELIRSGG